MYSYRLLKTNIKYCCCFIYFSLLVKQHTSSYLVYDSDCDMFVMLTERHLSKRSQIKSTKAAQIFFKKLNTNFVSSLERTQTLHAKIMQRFVSTRHVSECFSLFRFGCFSRVSSSVIVVLYFQQFLHRECINTALLLV